LRTGTVAALLQGDDGTAPVARVRVRSLGTGEDLRRALLEIPGVAEVRGVGNGMVEFESEGGEELAVGILQALVAKGCPVVEYLPLRPDLEDIFMHVTKGEVA